MRISDWSSDVCSSDLPVVFVGPQHALLPLRTGQLDEVQAVSSRGRDRALERRIVDIIEHSFGLRAELDRPAAIDAGRRRGIRQRNVRIAESSEEHTSELQSLMRISYAVFCLKKKKHNL